MKLATWNVNSLKVRLPHVTDWLATNPVDVLCLQETKLVDGKFPKAELEAAGYGVLFTGQPTYNGVAILYRQSLAGSVKLLATELPDLGDPQKRIIAAEIDGLICVCAYFPNGQALDSDKFQYKMQWIEALHRWLAQLRAGATPVVLLGDFNIAPEDRDVHDPVLWAGQLHCSPAEREWFFKLVALGFVDAFRAFEQPPKLYSWWDYRQLGFRRNAGLRIDHILIDERIRSRLSACVIDKEPRRREQPSDHTPVIATIEPAAPT